MRYKRRQSIKFSEYSPHALTDSSPAAIRPTYLPSSSLRLISALLIAFKLHHTTLTELKLDLDVRRRFSRFANFWFSDRTPTCRTESLVYVKRFTPSHHFVHAEHAHTSLIHNSNLMDLVFLEVFPPISIIFRKPTLCHQAERLISLALSLVQRRWSTFQS